jgi:hypothetical protein
VPTATKNICPKNLQQPGARERELRKTSTTIVHEPVSENGGTSVASSIGKPHLLALYLLSTPVVRALSPIHSSAHQLSSPKSSLPNTQCLISWKPTNTFPPSPKMAPPAPPASLISTATSTPTLSSRYDTRRKDNVPLPALASFLPSLVLLRCRSSKWTTTKRSASSPNQSSTTSSPKPSRLSRKWTRICKFEHPFFPIHLCPCETNIPILPPNDSHPTLPPPTKSHPNNIYTTN